MPTEFYIYLGIAYSLAVFFAIIGIIDSLKQIPRKLEAIEERLYLRIHSQLTQIINYLIKIKPLEREEPEGDAMYIGDQVTNLIKEAIAEVNKIKPYTRETSLVITKLEEALLWYEKTK